MDSGCNHAEREDVSAKVDGPIPGPFSAKQSCRRAIDPIRDEADGVQNGEEIGFMNFAIRERITCAGDETGYYVSGLGG
jgi:hypothetical protein